MKKIDEMNMWILSKSVFYAWLFLEVGLVTFVFIYSVSLQKFDLISRIPLIMAIASLVVFFVEKAYLTKKLTKAETDDDEE